ncbi:hypothetical protein ACSSZE_10885 [Acidithiobacillus caldus]
MEILGISVLTILVFVLAVIIIPPLFILLLKFALRFVMSLVAVGIIIFIALILFCGIYNAQIKSNPHVLWVEQVNHFLKSRPTEQQRREENRWVTKWLVKNPIFLWIRRETSVPDKSNGLIDHEDDK